MCQVIRQEPRDNWRIPSPRNKRQAKGPPRENWQPSSPRRHCWTKRNVNSSIIRHNKTFMIMDQRSKPKGVTRTEKGESSCELVKGESKSIWISQYLPNSCRSLELTTKWRSWNPCCLDNTCRQSIRPIRYSFILTHRFIQLKNALIESSRNVVDTMIISFSIQSNLIKHIWRNHFTVVWFNNTSFLRKLELTKLSFLSPTWQPKVMVV